MNKNIKKLAISTVAVGFFMWVVSGIWHNLVMANLYTNEHEATHEGIGILLIAYLILALFMAYLFPRYFKGGSPTIEGLKFGALIGLLWVFPHELAMVGAHGESLSYVFKNAAWHMAEQGIGGTILGLLHAKLKV